MIDNQHLTNLINYFEIINDTSRNPTITDPAFRTALYNIKLFVVEKDTLDYLSPEYTKNKIGLRKMPFDKFLLFQLFGNLYYIIKTKKFIMNKYD